MARKKSKGSKIKLTGDTRQLKVANAMIEKGGSMGSIMVEAGYSEAYSSNPQKLLKTKSFQALLDEAIPEDFATSKHRDLINAEVKVYRKGELETVRQDTDSISRGLDMYYKLKGKYAPEKSIVLNLYQGKEDREILEEIDRLEQELGIKRSHD